MNDVIETADAIHASANRLYWHSRDSVDTLASRLGMSSHAFYLSIRPQPVGSACSVCGSGLEFANRSAREMGRAQCSACGARELVARGSAPDPAEAELHPPRPPRISFRGWSLGRWRRELAAVPRERAAMVGGAAALGVAVGVLGLEMLEAMRW